jgi:3-oxoacyl-[acyl-carrier protein] reductase/pteridine reductase
MKIVGKIALVTGGAIRVGKAISLGLARAGAHVAINYNRDAVSAAETVAEAKALGVNACAIQADISDWGQAQRMFDEIHAELGPVDILVNNASIFRKTPVPTTNFEDWHTVTGVLINGAFYVSNLAAADMLAGEGGVIVNIVDLTAWEAWPGFAGHVVGKSALLALTRQLAIDLAPKVRANAIAPGPVLPPPDYTADHIQRTAAKTLLDRWGCPEDISRAVNFLVESDYINADVMTVDGGERYGHRKIEAG